MRILAACLLCFAISFQAGAQERSSSWGDWYFGMHGGITFAPTVNLSDSASGIDFDVEVEDGFVFGGALGYKFDFGAGFGPRFEVEATYRRNSLSALNVTSDGGIGTSLGIADLDGTVILIDGSFWSVSAMANGWLDVPLLGNWMAYAGVGVGITHAAIDPEGLSLVLVDDQDQQFSYQGGVGIGYVQNKDLTYSLDYRYFRALEMSFQDAIFGNTLKGNYESHNFIFTVRGNF